MVLGDRIIPARECRSVSKRELFSFALSWTSAHTHTNVTHTPPEEVWDESVSSSCSFQVLTVDPTERVSSSYGSARGGGGGGGEAAVAILASRRAFWEARRASEPRRDWTAWWSSRRDSFWLRSRTQLGRERERLINSLPAWTMSLFLIICQTYSLFLSVFCWLVWILASRSSAKASLVRRFCWVSDSSSVADDNLQYTIKIPNFGCQV